MRTNKALQCLPLLILVGMITATVVLWREFETEERVQAEKTVYRETQSVRNELSARLDARVLALVRMARRWEIGTPTRKQWEADAALLMSHYPGLGNIAWADTSQHVRWVVPLKGNEAVLGLNLRFEERRRHAIDTAIERHEPRLSPPIELVQGGKGFIINVPLFRGEEFAGLITGAFRNEELLNTILANVARRYSISVSENGEEIYRRDRADKKMERLWGREESLNLCGTTWRIRVTPTPELLKELKTHFDESVLVFGLVLSVLLALAVHLAQTARHRAREAMSANRELEGEIAERRRMEESLRHAEEKYRSIFENAIEGIFQTSPQGRVLTANPALARMLGYESAEELINDITNIGDQIYVRKEDREEFVRKVATPGVVHNFEMQCRRQDGNLIWISMTAHAVRDTDGTLLYYEGTMEDITGSRSLEDQLRQSQKMEAVGTLTGGIAHEFNNVLTAIVGHASLLDMKLSADDPLARHAQQILTAADRAARLTDSLMTFSRKQAIDKRPMNVNAVVIRVQDLLAMLLKNGIELQVSLSAEPLIASVDWGQIEQVLLNLVSNARDAMPNGGTVTISSSMAEIDQEFVRTHGFGLPGSYVLLSVADTGTGMDRNTRDKIFEPFFTTKAVGKGTGLGLSISYGIIKQHQGYINCHSEPGLGTMFEIYLPVVERPTQGKTVSGAVSRRCDEVNFPAPGRQGSEVFHGA